MKDIKCQRGITLISLIITIVLLVILSGIVIKMSSSNIIPQTRGVEANTNSQIEESNKVITELKKEWNIYINDEIMQNYDQLE